MKGLKPELGKAAVSGQELAVTVFGNCFFSDARQLEECNSLCLKSAKYKF